MARSLGRNHVMILRNHGLLACGRTVAQAFVRMYRLERACQVQLAAQATGAKLVIPSDAVRKVSAQLSDDFLETDGVGGKGRYSRRANPEFAALMRLMDQKDPSYRD